MCIMVDEYNYIIVIIYMRIMVDEYSFAPVVMRQAQVAINVNLLGS